VSTAPPLPLLLLLRLLLALPSALLRATSNVPCRTSIADDS
jgi:hypothetical protein